MAESGNSRLTDQEKKTKIMDYKEKGNQEHRQGNYKRAARSYYRSIMYIKGLSFFSGDVLGLVSQLGMNDAANNVERSILDDETKKLICDCYNNLSACMLKDPEPKYERIIEHCDKALEMSPTNPKALFRKALAQYSIRQFEDGLKTLQKAPGSDPQIKKYIELCRSEITRQDKELAARFKGMFNSNK